MGKAVTAFFFVSMWFTYIGMSTAKTYGFI